MIVRPVSVVFFDPAAGGVDVSAATRTPASSASRGGTIRNGSLFRMVVDDRCSPPAWVDADYRTARPSRHIRFARRGVYQLGRGGRLLPAAAFARACIISFPRGRPTVTKSFQDWLHEGEALYNAA